MVSRQSLVVVSVVLLASFAVVVPAASAAPLALVGPDDGSTVTQITAAQTTNDGQAGGGSDNASGNESAFGAQVTAFMQSNAAQAEDSVDNGMWEAAFERANESERATLAERRVEKLDDRLAELAEQNRTLYDRYRNGSISYGEYVSEASELSGRMEAMEDGVNGTDRVARRAGLNVSGLNELRSSVRNASDPEVAGVARGLASGDRGPPADVSGRGPAGDEQRRGGPPAEVPGGPNDGVNGNATANAANGTERLGGPGNATRGPGNPGDGSDRGQGNDPGGPGNDAPGNSGGGEDAPGNSGGGDDAPGNSDEDDDSTGDGDSDADSDDSDDDASEESESEEDASDGDDDDAPGNGGTGNSGGQGNGDDAPGRGPPGLTSGDILMNR